jgi:hypothetical protein
VSAAVEQCEAAESRVVALTAELSTLQHQLAAAKRVHDTDVHSAERTVGKTHCESSSISCLVIVFVLSAVVEVTLITIVVLAVFVVI